MKLSILIIFIIVTLLPELNKNYKTVRTSNPTLKEKAFSVLKTKCNICHIKKNRRMVFSKNNMNKHAKKIYKQVFKWKRMPKGNEIKLTKAEESYLKDWIFTLNI